MKILHQKEYFDNKYKKIHIFYKKEYDKKTAFKLTQLFFNTLVIQITYNYSSIYDII